MPLPNSLGAYIDISRDLNALLPSGGRVVLLSPPDATRWRHRANKYRALLRIDGGGATPYDHLIFRINQAESNVVLVEPISSSGHIETTSGQPIAPTKDGPEDELLDAARALAKDLGLE